MAEHQAGATWGHGEARQRGRSCGETRQPDVPRTADGGGGARRRRGAARRQTGWVGAQIGREGREEAVVARN